MGITPEHLKDVARLARIKIREEKIAYFTQQLDKVLSYINKLNQVETKNIEPTAHVINLKNVFREDEVRNSLPPGTAIKNAPQNKEGFFKVPKMI